MNSLFRCLALVAGVVLAGTALAGNYVRDNFEGIAGGTVLRTRPQWGASAVTVIVTNMGSNAYSPTNAVLLPVLESMTNTVAAGTVSNIVWTDFWTITRPFHSPESIAPDLDANATAQFFVNTNGYWVTMSRAGGSVVTSLYTKNAYNVDLDPLPNTGTNWCQVSVCHDYSNKVWSLFVGGVPVATNLGFLNQGVSNYQWLAVQSVGGDASNTTFMDDLLITNAVPDTLTGDFYDNGLRDAWELMYYGHIDSGISAASSAVVRADGFTLEQISAMGIPPETEDAYPFAFQYAFGINSPAVTTMDPTNTAPDAMRISLVVGAGRTNRLLGTTSPTGNFTQNVGSFYTGPNGETNWFIDPTALGRGSRYFYRLVGVSPDGMVTITNPVTYAWYQQSRAIEGTNYWVGVPVAYGSNNRLNSDLGRHLSQGLLGDDDDNKADSLTVYNPSQQTFSLGTDGKWYPLGGGAESSFAIERGWGILIRSRGLGSAGPFGGVTFSVMAGQKVTNTTATVTINRGMNMLTWPYDVSTNLIAILSGGTASDSDTNLSDRIWFGNNQSVRLWDNGWHYVPNTGDASITNISLNPGEGFFYRSRNAGARPWSPDGQ